MPGSSSKNKTKKETDPGFSFSENIPEQLDTKLTGTSTPETEHAETQPAREPIHFEYPEKLNTEFRRLGLLPGDTAQSEIPSTQASEPNDPEELADAPEDPSDSEDSDDSDEEGTDDEDYDDMSDLIYEGKPGTLEDILTHCKVTFILREEKYSDDPVKSAFLAKRFRGRALTWLTQTLKSEPKLLQNFTVFTDKLSAAFELTAETKKLAADKRMNTLKQTGAAQKFAIDFVDLADTLGYDDQTKQNAFRTRLKPEVRRQILGKSYKSYGDLEKDAITIDEELYTLRNPRQKRARQKGPGTKASDNNKN